MHHRKDAQTNLGLSFSAPLITSLVSAATGSSAPTFTRADGADGRATFTDFEGRIVPVRDGEARFQGARRVQNCIAGSSGDLTNASWGGANVTVTSGVSDPEGGTSAYTLTAAAANVDYFSGGSWGVGLWLTSSWIRRRTGSGTIYMIDSAANRVAVTITTSWQRIVVPAVAAGSGGGAVYIGWRIGTSGDAIDVWHPMKENVQGQSNQNPSEYVSVGVLSAPYHGAGVDGVRYFPYLNGNTVASNVVTEAQGAPISSATCKYGTRDATSGNYWSSPDSAAAGITGDIDIRVCAALDDWTPSTTGCLVSKYHTGGNQRSYALEIDTAGKLSFTWSTNGTATTNALSSVATGITDRTIKWVRVTLDVDNGASGYDAKFYLSDDGVTWTQLGTTQTGGSTTSIFDSTARLNVGALNDGSADHYLGGKYYRAQIYNGINGTLAVDFNPNDSTTAQTWTSSTTGETWTTNGSARVFGNTNATYGIPAPWDSAPCGYLSEESRQNQALRSNDYSASWTVSNNTPTTASAASPSGAVDGILLTSTATGTANYVAQAWSLSATTQYTVSQWHKPGTSTFTCITVYDGTDGNRYWFNLSTGAVASTVAVGAGLTSVTAAIKADINGFFRCSVTFTTKAATGITAYISGCDADASLTQTTGRTLYTYGAQLEAGADVLSYIPTTSAAVSRAADDLTYTAAGNALGTVGTASAEVSLTTAVVSTGNRAVIDLNDQRYPLFFSNFESAPSVYDGSAADATATANVTAGTVAKIASSWGGSTMAVCINGGNLASAAFDGDMNMGTNISIGVRGSGAGGLNGTIRNVRIYGRQLSAAVLASLTA